MQNRPFGNDDVDVTEVGLGTWQFGGEWGTIDDASALRTLSVAHERGIRFFDTADIYGQGRSEELIGRFLKESDAKVFVATKLGRFPEPGGHANYSLDVFRQHTEASLKRLGVDVLNLTQLHCIPEDELRRSDVFDWLRRLQRDGMIERYGASVETMDQALFCLEHEGIASLQIIFNIFRQKAIAELFDEAQEKGVAIIVRLPLASGLLAGKFTKESTFDESDHRHFNRDGQSFNVGETFAGLPFEKGVELADELKSMVPDGMTMSQMALRWILDFPAVTTVIPGASRPEQAEGNAAASDLPPLSPELHQRLSTFYTQQVAPHIRGGY
ncbi:General stress protein 69 [Planctomycetes bacterium Pan216]|uniref:General stress protein 69 n=1 Tax=Kolteria novifilia TaxID=2527975 RepID=A0A518B2E7_9BACT|nr:General stress protein 69 [Planctomycetes bacterium Pan216]